MSKDAALRSKLTAVRFRAAQLLAHIHVRGRSLRSDFSGLEFRISLTGIAELGTVMLCTLFQEGQAGMMPTHKEHRIAAKAAINYLTGMIDVPLYMAESVHPDVVFTRDHAIDEEATRWMTKNGGFSTLLDVEIPREKVKKPSPAPWLTEDEHDRFNRLANDSLGPALEIIRRAQEVGQTLNNVSEPEVTVNFQLKRLTVTEGENDVTQTICRLKNDRGLRVAQIAHQIAAEYAARKLLDDQSEVHTPLLMMTGATEEMIHYSTPDLTLRSLVNAMSSPAKRRDPHASVAVSVRAPDVIRNYDGAPDQRR